MNIHPLLVHFPIALLMIYAAMEVIRYKDFRTKATLVILGALSGYPTIVAGFMAKRLIQNEDTLSVVGKHQWFAISSIAIFSIIAIIYAKAWLERDPEQVPTKIVWVLAALGAVGLLVVGALGGSVVYGPTNDPVTNWIYDTVMSIF